jgi:hypothetical protein
MVHGESLYRFPGAAPATATPIPPSGTMPSADAPGRGLAVSYPGPASWRVVTNGTGPQVVRLRLTDVPGWHASLDGHPVALERFSEIMLQVRVPGGRHVLVLHYWPQTFTVGIILALVAAIGLGGWLLGPVFSARKTQARSPPNASASTG